MISQEENAEGICDNRPGGTPDPLSVICEDRCHKAASEPEGRDSMTELPSLRHGRDSKEEEGTGLQSTGGRAPVWNKHNRESHRMELRPGYLQSIACHRGERS